jgi:hypothetical protein
MDVMPVRRMTFAAATIAVVLSLNACTSIVAMLPARDAVNPKCADVIVRVPPSILGQAIRNTDAQATSAWGSEPSITLRCGVDPPGPTVVLCYPVNGIDWLEDRSHAPHYVFTTFGRTPAVQVTIDGPAVQGQTTSVLDSLAGSVGMISQHSRCVNLNDLSPTSGG